MSEKQFATDTDRALAACGPGGILALDLASLTGCAYGQPGAGPCWWSERHSGGGAGQGATFARFDLWMTHLLKTLAPRRVYAEMAFVSSKAPSAARVLLGFRAITAKCCFVMDRWLKFVSPMAITAFFVGDYAKGEKKQATIDRCAVYGWRTHSDDEADALALFVFGERELDPAAHKARKALLTSQ